MLHVVHVFKDGSTDPTKKVVPAEIVRRIHEIRIEAEANHARRIAAEKAGRGLNATATD